MTAAHYDRRQARDTAIRTLLPMVPDHGWTHRALIIAAGPGADLLFPGGPPEIVEAYIDMANRDMAAACAAACTAEPKISRRVRLLIATRLTQAEPHRDAVRRAVAVLAKPGRAVIAARCTAGTVDAIWAAAGDTSADFSWYTKRAILAGVYTTTLLYWLNGSGDMTETLNFLDRRLSGVARLGKLRARLAA